MTIFDSICIIFCLWIITKVIGFIFKISFNKAIVVIVVAMFAVKYFVK
jgi:hypothetical protein